MTDDKFLAEVEEFGVLGMDGPRLIAMVRERDAEIARLKKDLERQIEYCTACVTSAGEENDRLRKMVDVARSALKVCDGRKAGKMIALEAIAELDRIAKEHK